MQTLAKQIEEIAFEIWGEAYVRTAVLPKMVQDLAVHAFYMKWEESDYTRAIRKALSLFASPGWIDPSTPAEV